MFGDLFTDFHRCRCHDVEIAGVFWQKIARAFDFDEERDLFFASAVGVILD
jgi:hypothetical protein